VICGGLALLPAVALAAGAAITGVVLDDQGQPLPGVTVAASSPTLGGEPFTAWADVDGSFRLERLTPGTYTVQATLDGFQPTSTEITVVVDQTVRLEVRMAPATFGETLEVKAEAVETGEVAILDERRQASAVSDAISAEEISRTPDSDAAGVVERLTGISVVNDKYVYVRGLGERYSNTTLNGAVVPTTEPEKRVVPLDLFPAKLLENINVAKSYTPDRAGDFGGGLVELSTLDFPTAASLKVTAGAAYDDLATGEPFGQYVGGLSWNGEGGQPLPGAVPPTRLEKQSVVNPEGFTPEELQEVGLSFPPYWEADAPRSAPVSGNFSVTYGNTFGNFGMMLSAVSTHGYDTTDELQKYYATDGTNLIIRNDYALVMDSEKARNGLIGNFSLRLNDTNRLTLQSMFSRDSAAESRQVDGYNANAAQNLRDFRVRYQNEEVLSTRLAGEHTIGGIGLSSLLEWNVAFSTASNDQDQRQSLYYEQSPGVYALQGSSESGKMEFFGLDDEITTGGVNWTTFYAASEQNFGSVKGGLAYTERTRDFAARRFRFVTDNPGQFDLTALPNEIFAPENIRPDGFEILEQTGNNDAYSGNHTVGAAYLMADATFGRWRLIGGVRYEDSDQTVVTFDPFSKGSQVEASNLNQDVLPALNLVYNLGSTSNLRFAAARTLNRPEFRELTPFQYTEVTGGRSVAGNPELQGATIDSYDLRWEMFPEPGEVVAFSVFYKRLNNPIERIIQATTELRTSFTNAQEGALVGAEVEFRRSLDVLADALRWWTLNLNYTYADSEVTIARDNLSVATTTNRPLEGQSKDIGNLALQFYQPDWGTMVRLLYNYTGSRITDVGAYGLPDIYEDSFASVDLLYVQQLKFLPGVEIKIAGTNLLDETRMYTQGGELHRSYRPGRGFGLSIGYTIF
jgi:hypothetical protein